ncbi:MAG TPA: SurA N-terminal domain-containing protein [Rhizomicrobium sp.]|jgi:peptidyl-prolyl cis-trans isomerase D
MLQQLRKLSKSWISSIFLGALAFSFAIWGIADIFRGNVDTSVASVGGEKISVDDYTRDYHNFLRNVAGKEGHEISPDEARTKHYARDALETAISRTAVDQIVRSHGIIATDSEVSDSIRAVPAFKGPLGTFDRATFQQILARNNLTEDMFVAIERADLARSQLLSAVHNGFDLPLGYTKLFFDYLNEQRAIEYVTVSSDTAGPVPSPGDSQLQAYLTAHAAKFSTPEYRDVTYAVAGPQDVMSQLHVSEKDLQQQYELKKDQYQVPEKRDVEQITFPDAASANAARAKIDHGTSFADVATGRGLKPSDISLGTVVQADLGADRGPPTFALPQGGVSQPVKSNFGYVMLHVTTITPGVSHSFNDVKESLRKDVLNQLAQAKLTDVINAFDDASAGGANMEQSAKRSGMRVVHVQAVDRSGLTPDGSKAPLPASPDFLAQLQRSDVGEQGDPFPTADGNVYVIKVNGVTPPKLKPLDSVRAQVSADFVAQMQMERLAAKAQLLAREAESDKSLVRVAAALHTTVQTASPLARNAETDLLSAAMARKIFETPPLKIINMADKTGKAFVIARVTGIAHPPPPVGTGEYKRFGDSLTSEAASDMDTLLALAARDSVGVTINQPQVDRATGGS